MWEGRGWGGVGGVNPNVLMHFFVHQNILDLTESHFEYAFFMNFIPDPLHAKSTNNELLGDQSCNLK